MHDEYDEGFFNTHIFFLIFFLKIKTNQPNKKADHTEYSEFEDTHKSHRVQFLKD